jgi:hypothetical protein
MAGAASYTSEGAVLSNVESDDKLIIRAMNLTGHRNTNARWTRAVSNH